MQAIPITDTYAQTLRVTLAGQSCRIDLRQRSTGLFCDLHVNDSAIVVGVICRDRVRVVRNTYLGFVGDLSFLDTQGTSDPSSPGLGSRFQLCYVEVGEAEA